MLPCLFTDFNAMILEMKFLLGVLNLFLNVDLKCRLRSTQCLYIIYITLMHYTNTPYVITFIKRRSTIKANLLTDVIKSKC